MKRKLLLAALCVVGALGMRAQTDVTSTYLTNADFSNGPVITADIRGYGKDMVSGDVYGFQDVTGWTKVVTAGDNTTASYPNSGLAGGVLAYGSTNQLKGNNVTAPATGPDNGTGQGLGFFGVWGNGGYYYQDVTFPAGKYKLTFPIYCISGTQANTTYTGFFPTSGTNRTVAINTTVGSWVNQTVEFTLTAETAGQIRLGYQSTGSGSGANPHLVFDGVKIEFTAVVVKDVLETALAAATNANTTLNNSDLAAAISSAQNVYGNADATQDEVNAAAATLNAATELAMSAVGDVTGVFLANPGFESCTAETSNVAAKTIKDYSSAGWTNVNTGDFTTIAVTAYGGGVKVGNSTTPGTKKDGTTVSGNTLGIIAGWGDNVTMQSNDVTLPAGVYTLTVDHYLTSATANYNNTSSKFGFVTAISSYLVSNTTFSASTWTTETVTFTLTESTAGKIQIGLTGLNQEGSGAPAVFYDDITITYKSFLAGAKEAWDEAVAAATQAKTDNPNVTGEELTALNAELAKAEPTTVDGYNAATTALTTATSTLVSAAASYNALATVNGYITAAGTLEYADEAKKPATVTATNATDATTKTASQYTALRAYYESHALAEGVAGAVDKTSLLVNPNNPTNINGWTKTNTTGDSKIRIMSNEPYTNSDGTTATGYFDSDSWGTAFSSQFTQNVELPAGTYILTAKARGNGTTTYQVLVDENTTDITAMGNTGGVFGRGWNDYTVEFTLPAKKTVKLGINMVTGSSGNWLSFGNFRLVRIAFDAATATEYEALNDAIAAAEAKTLGFAEGEYAPYNNVGVLTALANAKAVDQEVENTKTDVEALTSALTSATWSAANASDVDAIFNGSFSSDVEGDWGLTGWTRTNNWGQQQIGLSGDYATAYYNQPGSLKYGDTGVYTMPLAANTWYKLSFAYRSHENNSNTGMTVSVLNGSSEGLADTQYPGNGSTSDWAEVEKYFYTGAAGNYILTLANGGNTWMTGVSLVKEAPADIVKTSSTNLQGYKTFYNAEFNYEVDENTTIYKATNKNGESVTITAVDGKVIPAGTPVIVKTSNTSDYSITFTPTTANTDDSFEDNILDAAAGGETGKYILGYLPGDGNGLGFYKYELSLDEGDVYLNVTNTANVRLGIIADGEATGIAGVNAETGKANDAIYNMAGQRVGNGYKGIVIKNGKKYMIK